MVLLLKITKFEIIIQRMYIYVAQLSDDCDSCFTKSGPKLPIVQWI
jgi:hypothetical protein